MWRLEEPWKQVTSFKLKMPFTPDLKNKANTRRFQWHIEKQSSIFFIRVWQKKMTFAKVMTGSKTLKNGMNTIFTHKWREVERILIKNIWIHSKFKHENQPIKCNTRTTIQLQWNRSKQSKDFCYARRNKFFGRKL